DGFGNSLPIQFEDEPQHTVGGRMRWAHVEDHFFADVAEIFARSDIGRGDTRHGIWRFDFARGKCHGQPCIYAGERRVTRRPKVGAWCVELPWSLVLGIWSFSEASHPPAAEGASAAGTPLESFG